MREPVDNAERLRVVICGADPSVVEQLASHPRVARVRECADVPELRSAATTSGADAAILVLGRPGLGRAAIQELGSEGIALVGLVADGDDDSAARWRRLGVRTVVSWAGTPPRLRGPDLDAALRGRRAGRPARTADTRAAAPTPTHSGGSWRRVDLAVLEAAVPGGPPSALGRPIGSADNGDAPAGAPDEAAPGVVIAVWGPAGAPGRSVVAAALADAATVDGPAVLVDADLYGGAQALLHGVLPEASGLLRAVRLAELGRLDEDALAACVVTAGPRLGLLSGLDDASAWPRLRPGGLEMVLDLARSMARVTVVDCGFCLEEDEELSYDTAAPRRNGATLAALRAADLVLAVARCDPVGQARLRAAAPGLHDLLGAPVPVILNRVGSAATRGWALQAEERLRRDGLAAWTARLPDDSEAVEAQLAVGGPLTQAAPHSSLGRAAAALWARVPPARTAAGGVAPPDV